MVHEGTDYAPLVLHGKKTHRIFDGFQTADFGRLTPQKSIRSAVEPEPSAPVNFCGYNRQIAV
jgi:hypothetical protein